MKDFELKYAENTNKKVPIRKYRNFSFLGWIMGFEPTTFRATIWRANQLCYIHHILFCWKNGTPEGTRTPDLLLRRQLLYPAELLAHVRWSGWRESDPRIQLGRLVFYHWTTPANPDSIAVQPYEFSMHSATCQGLFLRISGILW